MFALSIEYNLNDSNMMETIRITNIAKGTTDPRVEFISKFKHKS